MDFLQFILLCIITVAIAWTGVLLLGYFVPEHPPIIDKIIWVVCIVIILWTLINATGVSRYAPKIPHV